jgi:hypothetical protein
MADPLYRGDYQRRARAVRAAAYLNPHTVCQSPTCKGWGTRTLAEHPPTKTGKPPKWDAGHKRDSDPTSPLQPEVDVCNRSAGATLGNKMRVGLTPTRVW